MWVQGETLWWDEEDIRRDGKEKAILCDGQTFLCSTIYLPPKISHQSHVYFIHLPLSLTGYLPGEHPPTTYCVRLKGFWLWLVCFVFRVQRSPEVCFFFVQKQTGKGSLHYFIFVFGSFRFMLWTSWWTKMTRREVLEFFHAQGQQFNKHNQILILIL